MQKSISRQYSSHIRCVTGWLWHKTVVAILMMALAFGASKSYAEDALIIDPDGQVTLGPARAAVVVGKTAVTVPTVLDFGSRYGQFASAWSGHVGWGVQDFTVYMRTVRNFAWFYSGTHSDTELSAGGSGFALMTLSSVPKEGKGTLDVNGSITATSFRVGEEDVLVLVKQLFDRVATLQAEVDQLKTNVAALRTTNTTSIGQGLRLVKGAYDFNKAKDPTKASENNNADPIGGYTVRLRDTGIVDVIFNTAFSTPPAASVTQICPGVIDVFCGDTRDNTVISVISTDRITIVTGDGGGYRSDRHFSFVVVGPE